MDTKRTEGVAILVKQVLATLPQPYSEDIIEHVCIAIETHPHWKQQYDELCALLQLPVVNNWIGQYVKQETGYETLHQVTTQRTSLIKSYSKLMPARAKLTS